MDIAQPQFFGDEAEVWFDGQQDADQSPISAGFQQQDVQPQIEDAWDHWPVDDDEYVVSDDCASVENLSPVEDAYDHFVADDDESPTADDYALAAVAAAATQYYGEDAELEAQEGDDPPAADDYENDVDVVFDDPLEWPQDDDEQAPLDQHALVENLSPVEDGWDWLSQDDDEQAGADEFAFVDVAVTTLQYYGEDAELADLDQDDDGWTARDTDVLGPTLAQAFDDPWEHWPTEDDDFVVTDDYASVDNNPAVCVEDAWDWAEQGDEDAPLPEDYQGFAPPATQYYGEDAELLDQDDDEQAPLDTYWNEVGLGFDDAWDHFSDDDVSDLPAPTDDYQSVAPLLNPLLGAEDAWDHWPTDDPDDYRVDDDFQLPAFVVAAMAGVSIAGGLSYGTCVGPAGAVVYRYDPRFFNGANAWLGFRTATGGGVW